MIEKNQFIKPLIIFFCFFSLYLFTLHPALAPYRDAGEMATSAWTLGVSHPTSYPIYILFGRAIDVVPLGNPAYRLNILSALAAAAAIAIFFSFTFERCGLFAALAASALLGFNATFWSIAVVSEMYSLWVLGALFLLWISWRLSEDYKERLWFFFCYCLGLVLANRLDFVLWSPGLVWLALSKADEKPMPLWAGWTLLIAPGIMFFFGFHWPVVAAAAWTAFLKRKTSTPWKWAFQSAFFALLGFSIYAYLPIRSTTSPWLDWNHPAILSNFIQSILRTKYGGTLDLISENYAKGSLFLDNMKFYARHLWHNFSLIGILAALWGIKILKDKNPRKSLGVFSLYWWSGPFFLLLANMPPNPHSLAIVDPHYLLSDLIVVFWASVGIADLSQRSKKTGFIALFFIFSMPFLLGRLKEENRRYHFFDYDYARNIFLSAPKGATILAKKDVQIFSLWYYQTVQGLRPDLNVVAQGLIGSPWYESSFQKRAPNLFLSPLTNDESWKRFFKINSPVYATPDAEIPSAISANLTSRGLLLGTPQTTGISNRDIWDFFTLRGNYSYESQPDFFTSDLIDAYSQMRFRQGTEDFKSAPNLAETELQNSWSMHWIFPGPPAYLGYEAYSNKNYPEALNFYTLAATLSEKLVHLAKKYRALSGVLDNFKKSSAENMVQVGAVEENLKNPGSAKAWYLQSLKRYPTAQAHYDLAVLSWTSDPETAQRELEQTLALDPSYPGALHYLQLLRQKKSTLNPADNSLQ